MLCAMSDFSPDNVPEEMLPTRSTRNAALTAKLESLVTPGNVDVESGSRSYAILHCYEWPSKGLSHFCDHRGIMAVVADQAQRDIG